MNAVREAAVGGDDAIGTRQRVPIPLLVLLVLCVCAPPLVIWPVQRGPQGWMESISLQTAQETWLAQRAGDGDAWRTPTLNDSPRVRKPPLVVWSYMLAWSDLKPETSDWRMLALRARLVTAALGLVLALSVFWIGITISDRTLGTLAALAAGLMPLLQGQARMASYDIHMTAWTTLAVAAALWALNPFGVEPSAVRRISGWMISAITLSIACLSKEPPLVAMIYLVPVMCAIALGTRRSWTAAVWLLLPMAAFAVTWWLWHTHITGIDESASQTLGEEYSAQFTMNDRPLYFYPKVLLVLSAPWTLWLIAGLVHPFNTAYFTSQRKRLFAWIWFVAILVVFSINPGKAVRYILPIVPAAALLIGYVWRDHESMARRGERDPRAAWVFVPHWIALTLASVVIGALLAYPQWFHARGLTDALEVAAIPVGVAAMIAAALAALALTGWRFSARWQPARAALITAAWTMIATTAYWHGFAGAPNHMQPVERDSDLFTQTVGSAPVVYLRQGGDCRPGNEFLFFTRRVIESVKPDELPELLSPSSVLIYIIAKANDEHDRVMREAGLTLALEFHDTPARARRLWVHNAPPVTAPTGG